MTTYRIKDAAVLADASYKSSRIVSPPIVQSLDHDDVQAYLLAGDILLLPGSNSVRDYLKFNLRPLSLGGTQLVLRDPRVEKGASGTKWHQGFLRYARVIFDWLGPMGVRPNFIIGHSLGAAAAQILSKTYDTPTIGFAAPRPKLSKNRVVNDGRCLLLNRSDDIVPKMPSSFSHMGRVTSFKTRVDHRFLAHAMPRYRAIIDEAVQAQAIPDTWGG